MQAHPLQTVFNIPLVQRQILPHLMLLWQDLRCHWRHCCHQCHCQQALKQLPGNMPWRWRLGVWRYRCANWKRKWTGWRRPGRPVLIRSQWWSSWRNSYQPKHMHLWVHRYICFSGRLMVFGGPLRTKLSSCLCYMPVQSVTGCCLKCSLCHLSAHCRSLWSLSILRRLLANTAMLE